jgi:hypothetical protein
MMGFLSLRVIIVYTIHLRIKHREVVPRRRLSALEVFVMKVEIYSQG